MMMMMMNKTTAATVVMMMDDKDADDNESSRCKYRQLLRKAMHRAEEEKTEISSPRPLRKLERKLPEIAPITTGRIIDINNK